MKKLLLTILLLNLSSGLFGQTLTQTLRGRIVSKELQEPLTNVIVQLLDTQFSMITAKDGKFKFSHLPMGRYVLNAFILGYKPIQLSVELTSSAKEVVLLIEMEKNVIQLNEIAVSENKGRAFYLNEISSTGSRVFSIDDAKRYAGSLGDPARMIANYAGVVSLGDRSDIVIRGNSSTGLLWRLDGIEIPNPYHFGGMSSGGAISLLNTNILANSNFISGAFSAAYGNSISGVFDLKMKSGNDKKYEFIGKVLLTGLEFAAEGPINRRKGSSFLIDYRHSTIEVIEKLGVYFGYVAVPRYQDLSFKLNFPINQSSSISWLGIGGLSNISLLQKSSNGNFVSSGRNVYYGTDMAASAITYLKNYKNNAFKFSLFSTLRRPNYSIDSVNKQLNLLNNEDFAMHDLRTNVQASWYKKWDGQWSSQSGLTFTRIDFDIHNSRYNDIGYSLGSTYNSVGNTYFIQAFSEFKQKPNDRLTVNYGVHYMQLLINNRFTVEPRASVVWNVSEYNALSLSAGMHSQMQPLFVYFRKILNTDTISNKNIDFSKSIHLVVGYDRLLNDNWKLKAEAYYQHLYKIPISAKSPGFSLLNQGDSDSFYFEDNMINKGTGKNYGIELTLEKFFSRNYYFLFTTSIYNSRYIPYDGKERNTAFNGNYIVNALGGYEQSVGKTHAKKIKFDFKVSYAGGKRYTPLTLENPQQLKNEPTIDDQLYSKKFKSFFKTDLRFSLHRNGKKVAQDWLVDIQNVFNTHNVFSQSIDQDTNSIKNEYLLGIFPTIGYQIEF
ncbi:carboxypeptidase-like regulatory domain-containing protein [Solitalea koreensis]|nr:carboxypeptidase-like regulatory domain-containing protein [Solitalea koreensis]